MEEEDINDYKQVFCIDDSEVPCYPLLPSLLVVRLLDEEIPGSDHLYHGYQFLFMGDPSLALEGIVSATLISEAKVEITLPLVPSSLVMKYEDTYDQLNRVGNVTLPCAKAHATAVTVLQDNKELWVAKYLIDLSGTGETFTAATFNKDSTAQFGRIDAKTSLIQSTIEVASKQFDTTECFAQFNLARNEPYPRKKQVKKQKKASNSVLEGLSLDVQGMNI